MCSILALRSRPGPHKVTSGTGRSNFLVVFNAHISQTRWTCVSANKPGRRRELPDHVYRAGCAALQEVPRGLAPPFPPRAPVRHAEWLILSSTK